MIRCRTLKVAHDLRDLIEHESPQEDIAIAVVAEGDNEEDLRLPLRLTIARELPRTGGVS